MTCIKGTNWTDEELWALLIMWVEPESQDQLLGIHRNKVFYEKLADRLVSAGFPRRSGQSCRDKVNRIRGSYRTLVDQVRRSGQGRDDDPFWFEIIDPVLGTKPATEPRTNN